MVGIIYERIARDCFSEKYPSMDSGAINKICERGNFKEIESYIEAKDFIKVGINSICADLAVEGIYPPVNFEEIIFFSQTPNIDCNNKITEQIADKFSGTKKARIVLKALRSIHEQWRKENKDNFYAPCNEDKKFMFLPFETIGYEEALKYRIFIYRVFESIGLWTEFWYLDSVYSQMQKGYLYAHGNLENAVQLELPEISENDRTIIINQAKTLISS